MTTESVTARLARRVVADDHVFPPEVIELAKACVLDGMGNMLVGSTQPVGRLVTQFASDCGGQPSAIVLGSAVRSSAPNAAFCNGTFHRALDFDNVWLPLDHPVAASLSALVSLGLGGLVPMSGRRLLECVIVGMETQARLRIASDSASHRAGARGRGIFGSLAAAAACSRALSLSAQQTAMAIGIAAGRAGGIDNSGTMANPADSGLAARNGVEAALLARAGFTARSDAVEAPSGFAQYLGEGADLEAIVARFGRPWRLAELGVAFKKYPCQYPTHWGIDAVLSALGQAPVAYRDIVRVEVAITATPGHSSFNERSVTNTLPSSGLAGKFSVAYTAAAVARYGTVGIDVFSDEAAASHEMADALRKVQVSLLPPIARFEDMRAEAAVILADGRRLQATMRRPHGIWGDPLTREELMRKFVSCATRAISADRADALAERILRLDGEPDLRAVAALAVPADAGEGA